MRTAFLSFLLLLTTCRALLPQPAAAQPAAPLSEAARISMLTVLPGEAIYSLFGHSAFRVYDPVLGIDETYNYGTFEFGNPVLFGLEFMYGRLDYYLSVHPYRAALRHYRAEQRPVIEQVLNLTPAQRDTLYRFLQVNALPENRYYRYNFLFDNCSTRLRDALLVTLGDRIRFAPVPDPDESFRQMLDPYVADRPFLDLGFDLLLGTPTDRPVSAFEAMFLPLPLMAAFDRAALVVDGTPRPLVARTDTVFWIEGYELYEASPPWPGLLLWFLFALGFAALILDWRRDRKERAGGRRLPDVLLFAAVGLAGLLMLFMWFFSEHTVTDDNLNLLWAWPTHLIAAVALARRVRKPWLRWYLFAAAAAALATALGWPFWPQDLHPDVFPVLLLLALRSAWQAYLIPPRPVLEMSP